jgi:hypothetical protein
MDENQQNHRSLPTSELDLNLMLTNSVWGQAEVSQELKNKLTKYFLSTNKDGTKEITKEPLWGLLGFYTRDMRLGNLSEWNNELETCRYMIDLAGDLLSSDMIEPFLISLSRAATILETSQSKHGFLRIKANTLRHENINQNLEPPKKQLWGGKKNEGGY